MKLGQPQPVFANQSLAIQISYLCGPASVESGRVLFTMVTCDTSQMLTLFVLLWLNRVQSVILHQPVGSMTSRLTNHTLVVNIEDCVGDLCYPRHSASKK